MHLRSMILRYLIALAVTLGAYSIYALTVAPLIDGGPDRLSGGPLIPPEGIRQADEIKQELTGLFPKDGWEWKSCSILESRQAKLLFRRYEILDDGTVHLEPLTMVLMPAADPEDGPARPSSPESSTTSSPVVLRAPWGANVKFEHGLQLGGKPGNLESAQLRGEVQIYRPAAAADQDDAMYLVTQNVQISRERIFTLYECQFQFGQSYGSGKHLTIDLVGPGGRRPAATAFAGIERIELGSVDELILHREADPAADAESASHDLLGGAGQSLHIRCAGPMVYENADQRISFADDVVVRSVDGQNQLNCEDLMVYLGPSADTPDAAGARPVSGQAGQMEIQRLLATGAPAVLTAADQNAQITADRVDFDLITRTVVLSSRQSAWLLRNGQQIQAPEIQYTFTDDGRLGTAVMQGPGTIRQQADQQNAAFECRWQNRLTLQNDGGRKVLSLDEATVEMTDMRLNAAQLHLWMWETPETDESGTTRYHMVPAKMFAEGQVKINSPQLEGDCSQAAAFWPEPDGQASVAVSGATRRVTVHRVGTWQQMTWKQEASAIPATTTMPPPGGLSWQANGPRTATANLNWQSTIQPAEFQQPAGRQLPVGELPPPRGNNPARPPDEGGGKTRFVGNQVQLQMLGGDDPGAIDEITVDGDVVVQQQQSTPAGEFRVVLEIRGDKLRAIASAAEQHRLFVSGTSNRPATVAARQINLSGLEIHLDQAANRLWIDGPGEMQLTPESAESDAPDTTLPGRTGGDLLTAQETTVEWAGGMVFDGQKIYFETDVRSHSRQTSASDQSVTTTTTRSAALSIVLNQYLDFQRADAEAGTDQLKADRLVMVGWMDAGHAAFPDTHQDHPRRQVWIAAGRYDPRGQMISNQELFAPRSTYDVASGLVDCQGRGSVLVRQLATAPATGTPQTALTSAGQRSGPIDFIKIDYDDSFRGNLEQRQLEFLGNVHTLYTDCTRWNEVPPESALNQPARRGLILDCEQLELAQWAPAGGPPVVDLTATGNARARGNQFDATAERISYFEGNGLVTIEAPTRGDAEFWFNRPGQSSRGHLIAKRIVYNLETGTYEVDQMKQIDYNSNQ